MSKKPAPIGIQKPTLSSAAQTFIAGQDSAVAKPPPIVQGVDSLRYKKPFVASATQINGRLPPTSDTRLTVNISKEHHLKIKLAAIKQSTTVGELIEEWIDKNL